MDLLDNSYIKTAARYTVLGGYDAMISEGLSKLTQPDLVVLLDVDPRRALARRHGVFSPVESANTGSAPSHFIRYQSKLRDALVRASDQPNWVVLDGSPPLYDVVASVKDTLRKRGITPC